MSPHCSWADHSKLGPLDGFFFGPFPRPSVHLVFFYWSTRLDDLCLLKIPYCRLLSFSFDELSAVRCSTQDSATCLSDRRTWQRRTTMNITVSAELPRGTEQDTDHRAK